MDYIMWHDNSSLRTGSQVELGAKTEKSANELADFVTWELVRRLWQFN